MAPRPTRAGESRAETSPSWLRLAVAAGVVSAVAVAVWLGAAQPRPVHPLLVISVGGLRHDLLDRLPASQLPFFSQVRRHGAQAEWLNPILPGPLATTASVFTGRYPDGHGVLGAHFMDRRHGELQVAGVAGQSDGDAIWWDAEPLWCTVERHGGRATVFNVHGGCAEVGGRAAGNCTSPQDVPEEQDLEQGLSTLLASLPSDDSVPWLGVVHTDLVLREAEQGGVDSEAALQALQQLDLQLQRLDRALLQRGLRDRVNVVIVSDGGLADARQLEPVSVDALLPEETPFTATGNGAACLLYLDDQQAAGALATLQKSGAVRAFRRGHLPPAHHLEHPHRVPDILLLARPGHYIENTGPLAAAAAAGYDDAESDFPDVRGLLMARGPGVRAGGSVQQVNAVDAYSLMTSLLGVVAEGRNGRTQHVAGMLRV